MVAGLRDAGFDGSITLVGAEPELPYERPHLSKGYLLGTVTRAELPLRPAGHYGGVELVLGERVVDFGLEERRVRMVSGRSESWDVLCVATGSTARVPDGLGGWMLLRDLRDADALRDVLAERSSLEIVGAGFIGCEVAAVAVQRGMKVTVYEQLEQPLLRVLGPELGAYLAAVHRAHGVDLNLGATWSEPAYPTLVAAGSAPQLVEAGLAGLGLDHGIVVDEYGRTSAADVFAAGDVTRFFHPLFERRIRVEHFQTAQRQGFAVGRTMAGAPTVYDEVPWFWSDQYDLNLQYAGAGLEWDEIVVRGDLGRPPFSVFYLGGGALVAVAGVNDHHTVARARRVMHARGAITKLQLEDPGFDLRRALP